MARIRTVKPEFWRHPVLGRLPDDFQLLALSLLTMSDDYGFFRADPVLIRGDVQPFRDDLVRIHGGLSELARVGWIELCDHPEQGKIGHISKWQVHQRINRPTPSKLKPYFLTEYAVSPQENVVREQGTGNRERNREQGKENGEELPPADHPALNYAIKIIDDLGMPDTMANKFVVEAAVKALMKSGKPGPAAYEFLVAHAKDALDRGDAVNKFWFEDSKWRGTGHGNIRESRDEERSRKNAETAERQKARHASKNG